jgi:hypothetical protein
MRSQDGPHRETNSLSLRERARVRGKAARNRQGPGALPGVERCFPSLGVVVFIGSSQAGRFAERFLPHTPALSPRRGRTVRGAFANPERLDSSPRGMRCSLREREGGALGRRDRFQAMFSRLSPLPGPTALELGESTALFSLSSDGGGGEGRGEEWRFYWISPLPNPLPTPSSQGEGDRRSAFQCLIQWQCSPALSPRGTSGEREKTERRLLPVPLSPILRPACNPSRA